jgi:hypothetical protein
MFGAERKQTPVGLCDFLAAATDRWLVLMTQCDGWDEILVEICENFVIFMNKRWY